MPRGSPVGSIRQSAIISRRDTDATNPNDTEPWLSPIQTKLGLASQLHLFGRWRRRRGFHHNGCPADQ